MKKILLVAVLAALAALAFAAARMALRPEEARIRRNLSRLERLLSKPENEPPAAGLLRAGRASEYFSQDCRVEFNGHVISGRHELRATIHSVRSGFPRIRARFSDITIAGIDGDSAAARLTASASTGWADGETIAREIRLTLIREDGDWKIHTAETVLVLR